MTVATAPGQNTVEGIEDGLTALLAGHLTGAKLHLYKDSFSPSNTNVAADFAAQECDFAGYAAATLTWSAIGLDSSGIPVALSDRAFFQATDAVTPNTVGGAWITHDETGPTVHTALEFYPFPGPVNMRAALKFLGAVVGMQLPGSPGFMVIDY